MIEYCKTLGKIVLWADNQIINYYKELGFNINNDLGDKLKPEVEYCNRSKFIIDDLAEFEK